VHLTEIDFRTCNVSIGRNREAPNWDMAKDTFVMLALERFAAPIISWQGRARADWTLWPPSYALP
jgi:hypothetical protein